MFRMNGYVQDERYTAGAGRAGAVPHKLARHMTQGCAGAVPHKLARHITQGRAGAVPLKLALHITQA